MEARKENDDKKQLNNDKRLKAQDKKTLRLDEAKSRTDTHISSKKHRDRKYNGENICDDKKNIKIDKTM